MAERGIKKIWVDTMIASGAIYQWGLVDQASSSTVETPTNLTTDAFGIALDDAADGEPVKILRKGRCYGIDEGGDLNLHDYVAGFNGAAEYHKLETGTQGTTGAFGRVCGDDSSTVDDLVLCDFDFINLY